MCHRGTIRSRFIKIESIFIGFIDNIKRFFLHTFHPFLMVRDSFYRILLWHWRPLVVTTQIRLSLEWNGLVNVSISTRFYIFHHTSCTCQVAPVCDRAPARRRTDEYPIFSFFSFLLSHAQAPNVATRVAEPHSIITCTESHSITRCIILFTGKIWRRIAVDPAGLLRTKRSNAFADALSELSVRRTLSVAWLIRGQPRDHNADLAPALTYPTSSDRMLMFFPGRETECCDNKTMRRRRRCWTEIYSNDTATPLWTPSNDEATSCPTHMRIVLLRCRVADISRAKTMEMTSPGEGATAGVDRFLVNRLLRAICRPPIRQ
jgi:hypothetical protein